MRAWAQPDLGANDKKPDGDAHTLWRSASKFSLTLPSGQLINVKFIPGLVGELSEHQFDFTGSVSFTGFKSHFVLAVEALEFTRQSDYALVYVPNLVARFEAVQQLQTKNNLRWRPVTDAQVPQGQATDNDSFRQEPTMADDVTPELKSTLAEVVEELSPSEAADRQRLEERVERAFYESGLALKELRDRRLYRNTHKSFEQYCQDKFGYERRYPYYLIHAVDVVDNLRTISAQILPNKETQVRPLIKLKQDEQCQIWHSAVEQAGGKVPSARIVKDAVLRHKGIVERLKSKNPPLPEFVLGDVVEIKPTSHSPLRPFAQMWGVIERVCSFSYTVRISIARETQQCKGEEMTLIDDEYTADIKAVSQRIAALVQFELEPVEYAILDLLQRSKCFTPTQLQLLEWLEQKHFDA